MVPQYDAQHALNILVGIDILLGLALCFFGQLISKIRIILGLILGCMAAANIGFAVSQNPWVAFAAGIMGGLLGALLSAVFYFMGLFLIGAVLGGLLGGLASTLITRVDPQPVWLFISAAIGGGVVLLFKRVQVFVMILATALGGSGFVIFGILCFLFVKTGGFMSWPGMFSQHGKFFGYGVTFGWVALAAAGMAAQYRFLPSPETLRRETQMDSAATSWDGDSSKM